MDKLGKPIFIKENIIRPMFNKEFAKELIAIAEWFESYSDDLILVKTVANVVSELTEINSVLLEENSTYTFPYSQPIYELINDKARHYVDNCGNGSLICELESIIKIFALYRAINEMTYGLDKEYEEDGKKLMFFYQFLLDIYSYNMDIFDISFK